MASNVKFFWAKRGPQAASAKMHRNRIILTIVGSRKGIRRDLMTLCLQPSSHLLQKIEECLLAGCINSPVYGWALVAIAIIAGSRIKISPGNVVLNSGYEVVIRLIEFKVIILIEQHGHWPIGIQFSDLPTKLYKSEEEIYSNLKIHYCEPELREGLFELEKAKAHTLPKLIEAIDLKGILHNHSTYSDGMNTLEEMAVYCKQLGYEYLGICDHSQTASYAGGLKVEQVLQQHDEIEKLNKQLAPFKIFKGIESDILGNGNLDYEDDILKTFDFIVASVHANLKMDEEKATTRLLKAIENPYTTILGHPTGRLLLGRPGYPINHKKIIDACAANKVVIELNAHPYRLDIDWRWIPYCLEKGVMISINPDAHQLKGYHDMNYGVNVARKGLLTKEHCFNSKNLQEIENYFNSKK